MSTYSPDSFAQSQELIRTSRRAFSVVVLSAYLLSSVILGTIVISIDARDLPEFFGFACPLSAVPGFAGAMIGAVLVLVFGGRLSRQFCWVFAVASGILIVPVSIIVIGAVAMEIPSGFIPSSISRALDRAIEFGIPLTELVCVGLGIIVGIRMTRARPGFAFAASRMTRRLLIISLPIVAMGEIVWILLRDRKQFSLPPSLYVIVSVAALLFCIVAGAIAALCCAEKYEVRRFEVLPVNALLIESDLTADLPSEK